MQSSFAGTLFITFIMLLCVAIASMLVLRMPGSSKSSEAPLQIGTHVWPGFEPLFLANDQGYYAPNSIRLMEFTTGSDSIQAFRSGAIDAAAMTLDEALLLAETTPDISIVLILDVSAGADVVVAQSALSSLSDLKGKRVGLETSALGAYVLTRALQRVGMTPADVVTVPLETAEQERAFLEHRVEAVVTYEPIRTKLLAANARILFDSKQIPGEIVDVIVARRSMVDKYHAQIDQLVHGWFRALEFMRQEPKRASELMARREHISAAEFAQALTGLRFYDLAETRAMFTGMPSPIVATANQLGQVMIANKLLRRLCETTALPDGRFVMDLKP